MPGVMVKIQRRTIQTGRFSVQDSASLFSIFRCGFTNFDTKCGVKVALFVKVNPKMLKYAVVPSLREKENIKENEA